MAGNLPHTRVDKTKFGVELVDIYLRKDNTNVLKMEMITNTR